MINNIETLAGGKIKNEQGLLVMDPFRISVVSQKHKSSVVNENYNKYIQKMLTCFL